MDRDPEDLQFLGIVRIVGEAFKILRSSAKLLGAITLTLLLPLSIAILVAWEGIVSELPLLRVRLYDPLSADRILVDGRTIVREFAHAGTRFVVCLATYTIFIWAFSLLSTAAVVYIVASIYTGKEISYVTVMRIVPRVWKRLMVTFLWFFIMDFAYITACVSVFLLLLFAASIVIQSNWFFLTFGFNLLTVVFSCFHVYISMVWQLACIISVVEDKYGLGAMRKSKDLIKGKRIIALALYILHIIFQGIGGVFFWSDALMENGHGVESALIGAYCTLSVGLLCFVNLMGLLTQSVFYFVCKSYQHESIDKSSLSDHLEIYNGEYVPLKGSEIELRDLSDSV